MVNLGFRPLGTDHLPLRVDSDGDRGQACALQPRREIPFGSAFRTSFHRRPGSIGSFATSAGLCSLYRRSTSLSPLFCALWTSRPSKVSTHSLFPPVQSLPASPIPGGPAGVPSSSWHSPLPFLRGRHRPCKSLLPAKHQPRATCERHGQFQG